MNTQIHNLILLHLSFLLLIGEWGCAHQIIPPSPLPESIQQQLGKIGGWRDQRRSTNISRHLQLDG